MSYSKSVAVGYRSLQAIHDLRWMAASTSERTLSRLATGTGTAMVAADMRRLIDIDGCRLSDETAGTAHSALLLAATLPDDDYDAFRASTAILIADRLQHGAGDDDLFWHWDAFQAHYRTLPGPDRAAVLQGFRQLQENGRIALFDPPEGDWITSKTTGSVRQALEPLASMSSPNPASRLAGLILEALDDASALAGSAQAWTDDADVILSLDRPLRDPLIQGMRHIYERHPEWAAHRGRLFDPSDQLPVMLPPQTR